MIARVAPALPIDRVFDYAVPELLRSTVRPGCRVVVSLHGREERGIVVEIGDGEIDGLEPMLSVESGPAFSAEALAFCRRICDMYLAPLGLVANRALPRRVGRSSDRDLVLEGELPTILEYLERAGQRAPRQAALLRRLLAAGGPVRESTLRAELGAIRAAAGRLIELGFVRDGRAAEPAHQGRGDAPKAERILVRGASRYDRYAEEIRATLGAGGRALVVSPNALAAAAVRDELERRLSMAAALYHGGVGEGERGAIWEACRSGKVRLVVGTRSAIFLPLANPELVIVDEEQDPAHKQSEMLPYFHARTAALELGRRVILGSAVPAVETAHAVASGAICEIDAGHAADRTWEVVDLRREPGPLTAPLLTRIGRTLERGGRAVIAVARTGYFRAAICRGCGRAIRCRRCRTTLGYRPEAARGACPTCGQKQELRCEACGRAAVRFIGEGIERIAETLAGRFPDARVARVDGRTIRSTSGRKAATAALNGAADLIVGTHIVACGPPLPDLRLACVLDFEEWTAAPDFRAEERAFQTALGLASRLSDGRAIVQTRRPDREIVSELCAGDLSAFYARELAHREAFGYPPFRALARVTLARRDRAKRRADEAAVGRALGRHPVDVLGPTAHPRSSSRSILLIKAMTSSDLDAACRSVQALGVPAMIDIDPERL